MARTGGCACGAVRYSIDGDPVRTGVCYCKDCQRRTGSAFGMGCFFPRENVVITRGNTKTFSRTAESGNRVSIRFCPECGTSVVWNTEALPHATAVAGGTFDDTDWLDPQLHVWAKSAQKWVTFPQGVEVLQKSNLPTPPAS